LRLLKCAIKTLFEDLDDVVFGLWMLVFSH
jgi:hypothetical protein